MRSPVLKRAKAVARLSAYEDEIRVLGISRLALFGSVLHGQTHAGSDVDVLVQFAVGAKTDDRFFALSELLERCLGRRVELVTTEAQSPFTFWSKQTTWSRAGQGCRMTTSPR